MKDIAAIAREIIAREGGYVNDPDDPGGATKYGVTIGTMRRLGLDIDGDGRVSADDVRKLDRETAERIYLEHYFDRPRIAELPACVRASVFDMYVNAGTNAVKILQELLGQFGEAVGVDGVIGRQTLAAAARVAAKAPDYLADAYGIARRNYYYALADRRPASRKFARRKDGGKGGWITRAEEFISARYHLSAADHAGRTAAWA